MFFVGATKFGLRCLEALLVLESVEVVGVLTAKKEFWISYSKNPVSNVLQADFAPVATSHNLPVVSLNSSMNDESLHAEVFQHNPDCLLVAG